MDVLRCSVLQTIGCATGSQSICTSKVHSFSSRGFSSNAANDLKTGVFFSEGASLKVRQSWKQPKCSQFEISALLRDNAKPGDDNGASQLKISTENGAHKAENDDGASEMKTSSDNGVLRASATAKAENGNEASQSKQTSYNGALQDSESFAQTGTSSDLIDCNGAKSNHSGLFRTPISGGVQSATSSHNLPAPAVAVRNLIEQAQFAHLCTVMSRMHHRRQGYPFGAFVDFAADDSGHLIFSFSPLAIYTRNLLADPRCTVVIQLPGSSGLGNPRVTIFGDVYPVSPDQQVVT